MSGRTKGKRGERAAIKVLRAAGLDARGVRREKGQAFDVDAVILGSRWSWTIQVKREERAASAWLAQVTPGHVVMARRNREPWRVWVWTATREGTAAISVAEFAARVKGAT